MKLGGDGTVLYASWLFQKIVPPVLSFALGSLGFLTKFDYHDFQNTLTSAFCDGVTVSLRLRFEGTVMRSQPRDSKTKRDLVEELIGEECDNNHTHKPDGRHEILNDIVVDRGPNASMSHFSVIYLDYFQLFTYSSSNQNDSHVRNRTLRRRRTFHHRPSRWDLRRHPNRLHSLQPCSRRLPLPPRKPRNPRNRHLRPHALFPAHHTPRHHRSPSRRTLRC